MKRFYEDGYNVLWMNPIAFRSPFSGNSPKKSAWLKIVNKISTHIRLIRRVKNGFWVWVPLYLPLFSPKFDTLNSILIRLQYSSIRSLLFIRCHSSILWCAPGTTSMNVLNFAYRLCIYEAHDLISDFRSNSQALNIALAKKEQTVCKRADIILAASETIREKLQNLVPSKDVHLLLHGVDYSHFATPVKLCREITDIRKNCLPIAGYFGSLSDANDKQVFVKLANCGFSVIIIGKVLGDFSELQKHPNIHLVGPVKYEQLPSWAQGFDVALLNWRMHNWIKNCFPVKSLEYLAAGLPVVSCRIPVLQRHYSDVISFAETSDDFLTLCRKVISEDSDSARNTRRERVQSSSWGTKYQQVKDLICELGL